MITGLGALHQCGSGGALRKVYGTEVGPRQLLVIVLVSGLLLIGLWGYASAFLSPFLPLGSGSSDDVETVTTTIVQDTTTITDIFTYFIISSNTVPVTTTALTTTTQTTPETQTVTATFGVTTSTRTRTESLLVSVTTTQTARTESLTIELTFTTSTIHVDTETVEIVEWVYVILAFLIPGNVLLGLYLRRRGRPKE